MSRRNKRIKMPWCVNEGQARRALVYGLMVSGFGDNKTIADMLRTWAEEVEQSNAPCGLVIKDVEFAPDRTKTTIEIQIPTVPDSVGVIP